LEETRLGSLAKPLNRLRSEKSPYLLQHACNPIDWYPWGNEAFDKAKADDKPIFLSIGYSTCHWCHVMERESFSDQEIAAILSDNFVAIKVDREERPDIDTVYMSACQAMTGQGGWPLTIIMTPDQHPFFAGSYFPKTNTGNRPGLMEILGQIADLWNSDRQHLLQSGKQITAAISSQIFSPRSGDVSVEILNRAFVQLKANFDSKYGGFSAAPKFPTPHHLYFLLRYWKTTDTTAALEMVKTTLDAMYRGGIWDHIGYGFARYATDNKWLLPHFEKMLYDNALLAISYLEAYQACNKKAYATTAEQIFTYVLRDITSPEGAFYTAEDADSEGEEGKFYLWTPTEIKQVLGKRQGSWFCRQFDITTDGNYKGKNIPNLIKAGTSPLCPDAQFKLFRHRQLRTHPFKDDKILTAWNGLMIAALAYASRILDNDKYLQAAKAAMSFVNSNLRRNDGRLLARYRDRGAGILAYLDDYAFLTWGLIELYQATLQSRYLDLALDLTADMVKLFWDRKNGGFFLTGTDGENLIATPKQFRDGATPSGNSVAAVNLIRLARLTGLKWLEEICKQQLVAFGGDIADSPLAYTHFLIAVWLEKTPPIDITIVGDQMADNYKGLVSVINNSFLPELNITLSASAPEPLPDNSAISVSITKHEVRNNKVTVYACKDYVCHEPVSKPQQLERLLQS
jgi:uncharacterized protein YyaL (SSP411 family)